MSHYHRLVASCLFVATSFAGSLAWSQEGSGQRAVEEIVVTAQKREESLQEIPKQVQVVSVAQLQNNNITDIEQLVKLVPSMNGYNGTGMGGKTSMRGVGTAAPNIGAESKVGITLDGVPIPSRAGGIRSLLDIQQVEVLPGPQGTLAGRNATAGLINLVTRKPSQDSFMAIFQSTVTDDHESNAGAYLSGPISDKLAYSFSLNRQYLRGEAYNIARKDWDVARDINAFRGKLLFTPDDATEITFTALYSNWVNSGGGSNRFGKVYSKLDIPPDELYSALEIVNDGTGNPVPAGTFDARRRDFNDLYPGLYDYIGPNNYRYSSIGFARQERKTKMASATYERDFDAGTFTVIGSWFDEVFPNLQNWHDYSLDTLDIRPDFDGYAHIINYAKNNTLEVRFASRTDQPWTYLVGAYTSDGENRYDYTRLYLTFSADRRFGTKTQALFANTSYAFDNGTTVRAGVRTETDDIDYIWFYRPYPAMSKTIDGVVRNYPAYPPNYPDTSNKDSDSFVNYDFGVQHQFSDNLMAYINYGTANQGPIYDAEDINGSQNQTGDVLEPLPSEEVDSIEAGVKTTLADGKVTLNANLFSMDFTNYQAITNVTDPTNPTSQPVLKTWAAGAAHSEGLELTMTAFVSDSFRLDVMGMYNDATIDEWLNAPCYSGQTAAEGCVMGQIPPGEGAVRNYQPNIAGNRLADAAEIRVTAIGTYSGEINAFGGMGYDLALTVAHTGDTVGDQLGNPESRRPARTDFDVNLTVRRGPLAVSLYGVNITEAGEETITTRLNGALRLASGVSYPGAAVQRNLDRSVNSYYGLRLRYDFE